jgi:hypothetical protein
VWIFGRYVFVAIRWIVLLAVLGLIGAFRLKRLEAEGITFFMLDVESLGMLERGACTAFPGLR